MARKRTLPDFEKALEELERLVERMEEGKLSLEESLRTFERGMELSRSCQRSLDEAEQRIRTLSEQDTTPPPGGGGENDIEGPGADEP